MFGILNPHTQARPGTWRGDGSKEMLTTTDVGRGRLLRGTLLVTLLSAALGCGLLAYSVARTPRGESVGPTPDPSNEWSAAARSGVVPGNLASYGQVLQHATAAALRATSATASSCGPSALAERAEPVAVGSSWRHFDSHYASAHLWSCTAPGLIVHIVICCITALVEGLPWVPDRPTLGSRFFSGLCQVPAHKMVSGGFPRVFRFPQLLL